MPSVTFIGLGLNDERGMTLEGLEEARRADVVFAEFYTNLMPHLDLRRLEDLVGKKIEVLNRTQLENDGGQQILKASERGRVAFLVPGDPMIATTHISVRLRLAERGWESRVIHAPSIISAVCGATGLQSNKFGKSITLPEGRAVPRSVLDTISDNYSRGLHTLLLLDVRAEIGKQMLVSEAIAEITSADPKLGERSVVGIARIGGKDELVKAARMKSLLGHDFGPPPHSLVLPGKLHFMEVEALKAFCGATDQDMEDER